MLLHLALFVAQDLTVIGPPAAEPADPTVRPAYEGQVILKPLADRSDAELLELLEGLGVQGTLRRALAPVPANAVDRVGLGRIRVLEVDPAEREGVLARLASATWLEWAEGNVGGPGLNGQPVVPSDAFWSLQWHLDQPSDIDMDLPEAWAAQGSVEVAPMTVAVIDTGISQGVSFPDITGMLFVDPVEVVNGIDDDGNGFIDDVSGYDFVRDDATLEDENGHGNGVTSIFAAHTDNGLDIAGISPGVEIMVLKAFNELGEFPVDGPYAGVLSAAAALQYAADNGARIVNNSWGVFSGPESVVADAVQYALDNGVHQICAAGNFGENFFFPADLPGVCSVAAIDEFGVRSDWGSGFSSNFGPWVEVCAGGTNIVAYYLTPGFLFFLNGTSMAAPCTTGVAVMALNQAPDLSTGDLIDLLQEASVSVDALNPGFEGLLGSGHVNALATLERTLGIEELGSGLAGSTEPVLNAWGTRLPGDPLSISLSKAAPGSFGGLVFGSTRLDLPLFGGTLVPSIDAVVYGTTDASGAWKLSGTLASGLPAGSELYLQAGIFDPAAPESVAFSNALRILGS